jgi:hypothetical protein
MRHGNRGIPGNETSSNRKPGSPEFVRTSPVPVNTRAAAQNCAKCPTGRASARIEQAEMHASALLTGSAKFRNLSGDPGFRFELDGADQPLEVPLSAPAVPARLRLSLDLRERCTSPCARAEHERPRAVRQAARPLAARRLRLEDSCIRAVRANVARLSVAAAWDADQFAKDATERSSHDIAGCCYPQSITYGASAVVLECPRTLTVGRL